MTSRRSPSATVIIRTKVYLTVEIACNSWLRQSILRVVREHRSGFNLRAFGTSLVTIAWLCREYQITGIQCRLSLSIVYVSIFPFGTSGNRSINIMPEVESLIRLDAWTVIPIGVPLSNGGLVSANSSRCSKLCCILIMVSAATIHVSWRCQLRY